HPLVALEGQLSLDERPGREAAGQLEVEQSAELADVGDRLPHPLARCAQHYRLFDSVRGGRAHMQPPGCSLTLAGPAMQPNGCVWSGCVRLPDGRCRARDGRPVADAAPEVRREPEDSPPKPRIYLLILNLSD